MHVQRMSKLLHDNVIILFLSLAAIISDHQRMGWQGDSYTTSHHQSYLQGQQCHSEATWVQHLYQATKVRWAQTKYLWSSVDHTHTHTVE